MKAEEYMHNQAKEFKLVKELKACKYNVSADNI